MAEHISSIHIAPSIYGLADKVTDVTITITVVALAIFGWMRYFS